ncbi:MAG: MmgE/PrpD family protein [Pseudomonadota bacterium]
MTPSIARQFAQFACSGTSIPDEVLVATDRAIFDTLGAMIAGGAHPTLAAVLAGQPQHPGRSTLVTGGRCDAEAAAVINGMAAHVFDIDDTSYTGIMHGSAVILPVVLALAEELGAPTGTLQRAFVMGSEVTYTLAELCTHEHYFHGWWSTVTSGLIGATVAAGLLLDLGEDQMVSAIGMAAAASGGGKAVFGTDAKPLLVGITARQAIGFARMAQARVKGPEAAFEDARGYLKLLNCGVARPEVLAELGQRWRLVDPGLFFKTNPVCSAAHAAIDQMRALIAQLNAQPGEIDRICADVPELVFISLVYPDPQSPQEAQFSLPFALACVALHGRVRFEDLTQATLNDPRLRALMARVEVTSASDLSTEDMRARYPESARLTLHLRDGRTASGFCGIARGMPGNAQTDLELISKFDSAIAFAGMADCIDAKPGMNPAHILAELMTPAKFLNQRRTS